MSLRLHSSLAAVAAVIVSPFPGFAADAEREVLEQRFVATVKPFVETYCVSCHGTEQPKAQLNLGTYASLADVTQDHAHWQSADSPVPCEVYPSLAFDSLFENSGSRRTESILDRVKEHASSLSRQVSSSDQVKLDEYLTSVREVEKRVERMRDDQHKAVDNARHRGRELFTMPRPDNGLPEDIRDHMRLMCDIVALGFQTDKTRVASMLMCRDLSGLFYPFLDVRDAHHPASHDDLSDGYERVSRFYVSQVAHLAARLDSMTEGDGTVLDNTCLLFLNNMWSGSRHDNSQLPVLTVGGLGGTLQTGRVLDYREAGDEGRKLCSLYLSLMDRMGVKLDEFGDAQIRLSNL